MPFRNRNLQMLLNWEPDDKFDPTVDRLLITTDWGDTFVAYWQRHEAHQTGHLAIDMDFAPENLQDIPERLRTDHDFHTQDDWYVYIYDGDLTSSGPRLDIHALGAGWMWEIYTSLVISSIEQVALSDIDKSKLCSSLDGIYIKDAKLRINNRDYDARHTGALV